MLNIYTKFVRILVYSMVVLSGIGIVTMIIVVCAEVILRKFFNSPITGAYDIVKCSSAITICGALPYTTAVRGHVAIEYFYLKLSKGKRLLVQAFVRLISIILFGFFSWFSIQQGISLKRSGEVLLTLQVPVFWIPWVIAFSCGIVILVLIHGLVQPGKELMKL